MRRATDETHTEETHTEEGGRTVHRLLHEPSTDSNVALFEHREVTQHVVPEGSDDALDEIQPVFDRARYESRFDSHLPAKYRLGGTLKQNAEILAYGIDLLLYRYAAELSQQRRKYLANLHMHPSRAVQEK